MEYTQWDLLRVQNKSCLRLNPCCNGIYSMSCKSVLIVSTKVLILVVMEDTQGDFKFYDFPIEELVLILVVMEYTQWALCNC